MKRLMVAFLALLLILGLTGCASKKTDRLTMAIVCDLAAKKGESLSWSDFEQYPSVKTGGSCANLWRDWRTV